MKITIEIDGANASAAATPVVAHDTAAVAAGGNDGGAGPSGSETMGATGGGDADVGGPPQALLDEIAAAEAAGQMPGQHDAGGDQNAGAGPANA